SSSAERRTIATSPPAQNPRPSAWSISTASIPGSSRHSSSAAEIASHIAVVSACSAFGRSSEMWPTAPSRRIRTSLVMVLPCRVRWQPARASAKVAILWSRRPGFRGSLPQQVPPNDQPHDLVGALEDRVHAQVAPEALDRVVHQVAVAAVELERAVGDGAAGVGG